MVDCILTEFKFHNHKIREIQSFVSQRSEAAPDRID
jgi:hypothetical protein